jgi:hypothetical protein
VLLITDGAAGERTHRVRLQAEFAGYAGLDVEQELFPMDRGLQRGDVILQREANEWSELHLTLSARDLPSGIDAGRLGPSAIVQLEGNGVVMKRALEAPLVRTHVLGDVPSGAYELSIRAEPHGWQVPEPGDAPIEIRIEGRTEVRVELPPLGLLEVTLRHGSGARFDGEAAFFLGNGEPLEGADGRWSTTGGAVRFLTGRYVVPIATGTYSLLTQVPAGVLDRSVFTISGGQHLDLSLEMEP